MRQNRIVNLAAVVLVCAGAGCSTEQRVRTETALAKTLISDQQSNQIGLSVKQELDQQGVKYVKDAQVVSYVEQTAAPILRYARRDRPGIDFKVFVIDDPKQVNAFATPGGYLYVYTGLLLAADNQAEVAGVMGHEAGHVVGRHVERAMVNAYGLSAMASMALGENPGQVKELAAGLAATGVMRAHGRSEEIEADEYGARYTSKSGYDPRAMITFFEKLAAGEQRSPGIMAWLRTHPTSEARIDNLRSYIKDRRLRGTVQGVEAHRAVKRRLSR